MKIASSSSVSTNVALVFAVVTSECLLWKKDAHYDMHAFFSIFTYLGLGSGLEGVTGDDGCLRSLIMAKKVALNCNKGKNINHK